MKVIAYYKSPMTSTCFPLKHDHKLCNIKMDEKQLD